MSEVIALVVHIIDVKDNFVYLHRKYFSKFRNSRNELGLIKIGTNRTYYASCFAAPFNGNDENAFNISSMFARTLDVKELDTVVISNLSHVKSLRTVCVSPISSCDLPILEDRAEIIQETLLRQIRVVVKHQILSVWVSKSITVQIHVDRLDDDLNHGKLEEHTEVLVSLNVNTCNNCESEAERETVTPTSSTWDTFKTLFSFARLTDNTSLMEKESEELNFNNKGIFRCVLVNDCVIDFKGLENYPYNVFVASKHLTNEDDCAEYSLCRLTHLPCVSLSSQNQGSENNDAVNSQKIFVHLYNIGEHNIVDERAYSAINTYPTIFVSKSVFCSLKLKLNSKIKLELILNKNRLKPTQIDFTVVEANIQEEQLIQKMKNLFRDSPVQKIINNGHLFAVDKTFENILYLSFNPVNVPFVQMNGTEVEMCSLRLRQRNLDLKLEGIHEPELKFILFDFHSELVQKLKINLLFHLRLLRLPRDDDLENSNHLILEGDIGSGKSSIVLALMHELGRKSLYEIFVKRVECKTLKGKLISKLEKIFETALLECVCYQPAVLCLDDLDVLFTSSKQNTQSQSEHLVSSYTSRLSHVIHDLVRKYSKYHITILATAVNCSTLEPKLFQARGASLFSNRLRIPVINQTRRREYVTQFMSNKSDLFFSEALITMIVNRTEGYCIQDLSDFTDKLYFEVLKREIETSNDEDTYEVRENDVDEALSSFVPLSLVGIDLYKSTSASWKDVGGLEEAKAVLTEILIWPSQFPKVFNQSPLKMQSGVLLYGVPGSGKTLLASAVAAESGLNFISIKGPELLSKFVGESEEGVRNTFRKAQNAKPCIIFFDEFDSLAPRRGNDITGVTDRVVNQLLTELDGVEAVSDVWVLAATSRPDLIDPALLRPGRLGTTVYCSPPNKIEERYSILKIMSRELALADEVNWMVVAKATDGYTAADLKAVLYTAMTIRDTARLRRVRTCLKRKKESTDIEAAKTEVIPEKIDTDCLLKAVQETAPALKVEEMLSYKRIYDQFEQKDERVRLLKEQRITLA